MAASISLAVRELMDHSDILVTTRYAHLSPKHRQSAVSQLDEAEREVLGQ